MSQIWWSLASSGRYMYTRECVSVWLRSSWQVFWEWKGEEKKSANFLFFYVHEIIVTPTLLHSARDSSDLWSYQSREPNELDTHWQPPGKRSNIDTEFWLEINKILSCSKMCEFKHKTKNKIKYHTQLMLLYASQFYIKSQEFIRVIYAANETKIEFYMRHYETMNEGKLWHFNLDKVMDNIFSTTDTYNFYKYSFYLI